MKRTNPFLAFLGICLLVPTAAQADKAGDALLQKCVAAESRARTLQAHIILQVKEGGQVIKTAQGTLRLKKPNLAHIALSSSAADMNTIIPSDGKTLTTYRRSEKTYATEAADATGGNVGRTISIEGAVFFNPDMLNQLRATTRRRSPNTGRKVSLLCSSP
ncbi:MAG TPA: DUF2092 domain-containing protein [Chthonomonadaceae bacterium]|nr:DUF2092 domain-containing protein [Chthonomonadaceae bacterium]